MAGPKQGITADNRASERVPFPVDVLYTKYKESGNKILPFPKAVLTSIKATPRVVKDGYKLLDGVVITGNDKPTVEQVTPDSLQWSIDLQFESLDGVYAYQHTLFAPGDTDEKAEQKERWNNDRILHFYEAYMGANTGVTALAIGKVLNGSESTWENYYKGIANVFNTGKAGKPVFQDADANIPVRIKLTRSASGKNPNRLQMPLFGNVIERVIEGAKSSILVVEPTDKFEQIAQQSAIANLPGAAGRAAYGVPTAAKPSQDEWGDDGDAIDDTDL